MPDGTKIAKPVPINLTPSKESDDGNSSLMKDENNDSDKDNDEDTPDPDKIFNSYSRNSQNWSLPSGKTVEDIFLMNVSEYSKRYKQKKRLTPIERAVLRYDALRRINLSVHMKAWFTNNK